MKLAGAKSTIGWKTFKHGNINNPPKCFFTYTNAKEVEAAIEFGTGSQQEYLKALLGQRPSIEVGRYESLGWGWGWWEPTLSKAETDAIIAEMPAHPDGGKIVQGPGRYDIPTPNSVFITDSTVWDDWLSLTFQTSANTWLGTVSGWPDLVKQIN